MENKIVVGLISASIAIIMVALVLSPVIADAVDDQYKYYNNSVGQYSKVVDEPVVIEYSYDADDGLSYTVNGVPQSLRAEYNDLIFATSHAVFKVTNASQYSSYLLWLDDTAGSKRIDMPKSVSVEMDIDSVSVTMVKADDTTDSFEVGIDWGFYAVTNGDYRAVWDPYDVYINDIDQVYSVNWLTTTSEFFSIHGESAVYGGGNATVSYDLTPASGVVNVFNFTRGDFILTVDNNGTPYEAIPFNVIVPVEIIGDKSNHSDAISAILSAIIPLIIIAVALMAVSLTRRY